MKNAILPQFLRPKQSSHLVRLGRRHDGGYLIDRRDIGRSDNLLSLGINGDWSFERDFVSFNDVDIFAYDASISRWIFAKKIIDSFVRINKPQKFWRSLFTLYDYHKFFRGKRRHIEQFVGLNAPPRHIMMAEIFASLNDLGLRRSFIKIDIEGSEYRLLDTLVEYADMTSGLVIEFHDCDLHLERIEGFICRYNLQLIHIHANNYAPMNENGLPLVIEMTFSPSAAEEGYAVLPDPSDMANAAAMEDYSLAFC